MYFLRYHDGKNCFEEKFSEADAAYKMFRYLCEYPNISVALHKGFPNNKSAVAERYSGQAEPAYYDNLDKR